MKTSRLITSILYEPWMILPQVAEGYLPMIESWLSGKTEITPPEPLAPMPIHMAWAGSIDPGTPEDIADFPDGSVGIVSLKGEMTKYDGMCSYGSSSYANVIRLMGMAPNISSVVLDIDGPGGSVNAISPLVEAIQSVQAKGKPVIGHADMMASAHYYVGVHSDYLMLDNSLSSQAGSVGVVIQLPDYRQYFEQKGIKLHTIYAPQSTHKNQEFEAARDGDYTAMKQNVLSPLALSFQKAVRENRQGKLKESEGVLTGSMFFAPEAVQNGMVDGVGSLSDAIQRALDSAEIRKFMHHR